MASTLPVAVVPLFSVALLVITLIIVVQWSKAYGRRLQRGATAQLAPATGTADEAGTSAQLHEH